MTTPRIAVSMLAAAVVGAVGGLAWSWWRLAAALYGPDEDRGEWARP